MIRFATRRARGSDTGSVLNEYALLIAFIAVLCIAAVTLLGGWAQSTLDSVADRL